MFYIDDLLTENECYILKIGDEIIGRAPIKEDFVLRSSYEWQDTDIRSVVDLFMDSMKQTFKNFRQLQGHAQQFMGRVIADDPALAKEGYKNIAEGKSPLDTKYLTIPLYVRSQSAYQLPSLTFIFVNKDDGITHLEKAEKFLWQVSGVKKGEYEETKWNEETKQKETTTYETYFTPSNSNKPGYVYYKDGKPGAQAANCSTGFTLVKGNLWLQDLSLSAMDISLSKELNLKGYPQAIRITLTFKDTQRRYPAEAIKLLKMAGQASKEEIAALTTKTPKKPQEKKTQNTTRANTQTTSGGRNI